MRNWTSTFFQPPESFRKILKSLSNLPIFKKKHPLNQQNSPEPCCFLLCKFQPFFNKISFSSLIQSALNEQRTQTSRHLFATYSVEMTASVNQLEKFVEAKVSKVRWKRGKHLRGKSALSHHLDQRFMIKTSRWGMSGVEIYPLH